MKSNIEVKPLVNFPSPSLPGYLGTYHEEETEAQKIARREKYMSTGIVKVDLLKPSVTIYIPYKVWDEIERNNKRIEYINEVREKAKRNPMYDNRFPEGSTPVRDIDQLLEDIEKIENNYVFESLDKPTTNSLHNQLQVIFDRFVNDYNSYTMYI